MDLTEIISSLTLTITLLAMLSATCSDVRTRTVSDLHWVVIGFAGNLGYIACNLLLGFRPDCLLMGVAGAAALLTVHLESERACAVCALFALVATAISLATGRPDERLFEGLIPVVFCPLLLVCYWVGIIRGGADVKCLISLGFVMPGYPEPVIRLFGEVPDVLQVCFVPVVSVLFLASLLSVAGCMVGCMVKNHGRLFKGCFHEYPVPVASVGCAHVWPCERLIDGERVRCPIPDEGEVAAICDEFHDAGISEIHVTPMMPFILPITVALLIVLAFGSPLFIW